MRRKNPVSVKVKAPSRGLVTRLPSELADLMSESDLARVCVAAENVRFSEGVISCAPGYERVHVSTDLLEDLVSHWRLDEAGGTRVDSHGGNDLGDITSTLSTTGKLGQAAVITTFGTIGEASGSLSVAPTGSITSDFTISGWVKFGQVTGTDQVIFVGAQSSPGILIERVGTALKLTVAAAGGSGSVTNAVVLSASTWYFFSARLDTANDFLSLRVNSTTTSGANGSYVHGVTLVPQYLFVVGPALSASFSIDSVSLWTRFLTSGEQDTLYKSGNGLDYDFLGGSFCFIFQGNLISETPEPLILGTSTSLYTAGKSFTGDPRTFTLTLTEIFSGATADSEFRWSATNFYDKIIAAQNGIVPQYWTTGTSRDVPGLSVLDAGGGVDNHFDGVFSFASRIVFWEGNRIKWSDVDDFSTWVPVASTIASVRLTLTNNYTQLGTGVASAFLDVDESSLGGLTVGQYVRIDYEDGGIDYYNTYLVTAVDTGAMQVKISLQNFTGATPLAEVIPAGSEIVTLDANEAGEAVIAGANANGPILQCLDLGEDAFIFKNKSVHLVQSVGRQSGVFYIRPVFTNEGLISRNALAKVGAKQYFFLGHRELYSFDGGSEPTPVCLQYTRQLFSELDRNRVDEISLCVYEEKNELWIQYPTAAGGSKILIWNYFEQSASTDRYGSELEIISAAVSVDWALDPAWLAVSVDLTWDSEDSSVTWASLVGGGKERQMLVAMSDSELLIHGNVFSRVGEGYDAFAETMDHDFGDPDAFKFCDVVRVGLQVRTPDTATRNLYVQLGTRTSMDADVVWSSEFAIPVQGNANFTAKVNPGGSGRFMRLRFLSRDASVDWRVSSYEIFCRLGGTY